jgi:hypothetical protein
MTNVKASDALQYRVTSSKYSATIRSDSVGYLLSLNLSWHREELAILCDDPLHFFPPTNHSVKCFRAELSSLHT